MHLPRQGCEYLLLTPDAVYSDTGDPVPLGSWEASFDGQVTWLASEIVAVEDVDFAGWLLAGPDASEDDTAAAVAVIAANVSYHLRFADNPETVITRGGMIRLVTP